MIFLLGGPPRVGKSIISRRIQQKHAMSVIPTDSLGAVLESVLSPKAAPDLFVFNRFNKMPFTERINLIKKDSSVLIDYLRKESYVVWKAVEAFIRKENNEKRDALVEGVAVLPELISRLKDIPHRVVFIGNQGENHKKNIKRFAEEDENDWLSDTGDQYISVYATFVNRMSAFIEKEAIKYDLQYIEMEKESFRNIADQVIKSLGLNAK